jgi:hypothetical protein
MCVKFTQLEIWMMHYLPDVAPRFEQQQQGKGGCVLKYIQTRESHWRLNTVLSAP